MTTIVMQSNASGTGSITFSAPDTASNRVLSIPDATTSLVGTDTTQTLSNKTLTTPNIDSAPFATVVGTAPIYGCRAWVNFNGTGTVAIRASGNVSSITDNGVGSYTVNFTTAMADTNYGFAFGLSSGNTTNPNGAAQVSSKTINSIQIGSFEGANVTNDYPQVSVAIFR